MFLPLSISSSIRSIRAMMSIRTSLSGQLQARCEDLGHRVGHEPAHVPSQGSDLLDRRGAQVRVFRYCHDKHSLDACIESMVELRHLELALEVRHRAQALDDDVGVHLLGEVDEQAVERPYRHVGEGWDRVLEERDALLKREQRAAALLG